MLVNSVNVWFSCYPKLRLNAITKLTYMDTFYSRYRLLIYLGQRKQNKFITRWRNCDYFRLFHTLHEYGLLLFFAKLNFSIFYGAIRTFLVLNHSSFGVCEGRLVLSLWARKACQYGVNLALYYEGEFGDVEYDGKSCRANICPAYATFPTTWACS